MNAPACTVAHIDKNILRVSNVDPLKQSPWQQHPDPRRPLFETRMHELYTYATVRV